MKKTRSNARWAGLTAAQRKTLEMWLFEDQINYEEALRRAREELKFEGSVSSLKRFYLRRYHERLLESMAEEQGDAEEIEDGASSTALFRTAGMKLAARAFFHQVRETPENVKEWSPLAKLMLWSEDLELRRTLKAEENQLRRDRLAFARDRFQFNIVEKALKMLPELQELAEARKNPKTETYEENKKWNAIKLNMFGDALPEGWRKAESAEEERMTDEEKRRLEQAAMWREPETSNAEHRPAATARQRGETLNAKSETQEIRKEGIAGGSGKGTETSNTEHRTPNIERKEVDKAQEPIRLRQASGRQGTSTIGATESGAGNQEIREEGKIEGARVGQTSNSEHRTLNTEGEQNNATCGPASLTDEEWGRRNKAA